MIRRINQTVLLHKSFTPGYLWVRLLTLSLASSNREENLFYGDLPGNHLESSTTECLILGPDDDFSLFSDIQAGRHCHSFEKSASLGCHSLFPLMRSMNYSYVGHEFSGSGTMWLTVATPPTGMFLIVEFIFIYSWPEQRKLERQEGRGTHFLWFVSCIPEMTILCRDFGFVVVIALSRV